MNLNRYTEKAQEAILAAQQAAEQNGHPEVLPEHLVVALTGQRDGIVPAVLGKMNVDIAAVTRSVQELLDKLPRAHGGAQPGLSSRLRKVLTAAEQELTNLIAAYMDAEQQLNRPPKNAEELKTLLKRFGDPDDLLTSPNDGEAYVVVWGANLAGGPTEYEGMFPIIAYERKGTGSGRAVVDIRGRPLTVPQGDFTKLTFVRGHKPSG